MPTASSTVFCLSSLVLSASAFAGTSLDDLVYNGDGTWTYSATIVNESFFQDGQLYGIGDDFLQFEGETVLSFGWNNLTIDSTTGTTNGDKFKLLFLLDYTAGPGWYNLTPFGGIGDSFGPSDALYDGFADPITLVPGGAVGFSWSDPSGTSGIESGLISGEMFITFTPAPGALALLGLAGLAPRRRK